MILDFAELIHRCDGNTECKITASSDLGRSFNCDDKPKYLTVNYVCV